MKIEYFRSHQVAVHSYGYLVKVNYSANLVIKQLNLGTSQGSKPTNGLFYFCAVYEYY